MRTPVQSAADTIRAAILSTEHLTDRAAEAQALFIATLLEQRRAAGQSVGVGVKEIDRALEALGQSLGSLRSLARMHYGLGQISKELGLDEDYGPSETVPNQPGGMLTLVA